MVLLGFLLPSLVFFAILQLLFLNFGDFLFFFLVFGFLQVVSRLFVVVFVSPFPIRWLCIFFFLVVFFPFMHFFLSQFLLLSVLTPCLRVSYLPVWVFLAFHFLILRFRFASFLFLQNETSFILNWFSSPYFPSSFSSFYLFLPCAFPLSSAFPTSYFLFIGFCFFHFSYSLPPELIFP